jgi:tRNA threonylcarbamoyladenosine biosynthesis protein TsaB
VIILAIDTSETRGSVAVHRGGVLSALREHDSNEDYSSWLIPAVEELLALGGSTLGQVDMFAASTGPGSFTGLRVGLTAVKAWAEVYGKPVVGISRLEAMARLAKAGSTFIASTYDAQRGQMFGGLYGSRAGFFEPVEEEQVIAPEGFLAFVNRYAGSEAVSWVSLDPELVTNLVGWERRLKRGDSIFRCSGDLAKVIGVAAEERAIKGELTDPLQLDANYVRRSDAEIFWKAREACRLKRGERSRNW